MRPKDENSYFFSQRVKKDKPVGQGFASRLLAINVVQLLWQSGVGVGYGKLIEDSPNSIVRT